jgi:hypothetical protein
MRSSGPPNPIAMTRRIFEYRSFPVTPEEALTQVEALIAEGKGERDFRRWLAERGGGYDRRFAQLLFLAIHLGRDPKYPIGTAVEGSTVFWRLDCKSRYCADHEVLDGLVRNASDPVWQDIYPPNGWCCGCQIVVVDGSEIETVPQPEVTVRMTIACSNWFERDLEDFVNENWR